ncbi:MAG: sigma 54 modulation/S30EA ribosomal C-terminal domain-containing protein, partial [Bryobacteraceae bacterium]
METEPAKKTAKMNGAPIRALRPKIFRVAPDGDTKPMTLEEAIMVMQSDRDYIVYRDLDRSGLSVLFRRRDGNLDLIET